MYDLIIGNGDTLSVVKFVVLPTMRGFKPYVFVRRNWGRLQPKRVYVCNRNSGKYIKLGGRRIYL